MKPTTHESASLSSRLGSSVVALVSAAALYAISYAVLFEPYIFPHVNHGMGGLSYAMRPHRTMPRWVYFYSPAVELHKRWRMQDFYYQF